MRYGKRALVVGTCAAACAAPLLFGTAAAVGAAGLGFLGWSEVGLAAVLVAAGAGFLLGQRFKLVRPAALNTGCGCAPSAGCNTGSTCDLPSSIIVTATSPRKEKAPVC